MPYFVGSLRAAEGGNNDAQCYEGNRAPRGKARTTYEQPQANLLHLRGVAQATPRGGLKVGAAAEAAAPTATELRLRLRLRLRVRRQQLRRPLRAGRSPPRQFLKTLEARVVLRKWRGISKTMRMRTKIICGGARCVCGGPT